jgi:hypothetical protein
MHTNFETMTSWEIEKAAYLVLTAKELGMNLNSYGELSVNPNSGYTYIWLENYDFCLYMPIICDLKRDDIYVLHTDSETGKETEESLIHFESTEDIEEWIKFDNISNNI